MKHKISVSIEEETLLRLREELRNRKFRNRSHAVEYADYFGIRVNCVSSSATETGMIRQIFAENDGLEDQLVSAHPLGRLAHPRDVAHAILYLASDDSSFVTGRNLVLDGGRIVYS